MASYLLPLILVANLFVAVYGAKQLEPEMAAMIPVQESALLHCFGTFDHKLCLENLRGGPEIRGLVSVFRGTELEPVLDSMASVRMHCRLRDDEYLYPTLTIRRPVWNQECHNALTHMFETIPTTWAQEISVAVSSPIYLNSNGKIPITELTVDFCRISKGDKSPKFWRTWRRVLHEELNNYLSQAKALKMISLRHSLDYRGAGVRAEYESLVLEVIETLGRICAEQGVCLVEFELVNAPLDSDRVLEAIAQNLFSGPAGGLEVLKIRGTNGLIFREQRAFKAFARRISEAKSLREIDISAISCRFFLGDDVEEPPMEQYVHSLGLVYKAIAQAHAPIARVTMVTHPELEYEAALQLLNTLLYGNDKLQCLTIIGSSVGGDQSWGTALAQTLPYVRYSLKSLTVTRLTKAESVVLKGIALGLGGIDVDSFQSDSPKALGQGMINTQSSPALEELSIEESPSTRGNIKAVMALLSKARNLKSIKLRRSFFWEDPTDELLADLYKAVQSTESVTAISITAADNPYYNTPVVGGPISNRVLAELIASEVEMASDSQINFGRSSSKALGAITKFQQSISTRQSHSTQVNVRSPESSAAVASARESVHTLLGIVAHSQSLTALSLVGLDSFETLVTFANHMLAARRIFGDSKQQEGSMEMQAETSAAAASKLLRQKHRKEEKSSHGPRTRKVVLPLLKELDITCSTTSANDQGSQQPTQVEAEQIDTVFRGFQALVNGAINMKRLSIDWTQCVRSGIMSPSVARVLIEKLSGLRVYLDK